MFVDSWVKEVSYSDILKEVNNPDNMMKIGFCEEDFFGNYKSSLTLKG